MAPPEADIPCSLWRAHTKAKYEKKQKEQQKEITRY